ncbi:hypothetical protein KCU81_g2111, partial [Aureobasidium melanogenum]|uniref:Uncharacterized protein n=1 Tax=Aureobasidium melanogenum (strain CBS 110374) TaxID=1043003 RepID=A0A074VNU0_AURM1
MIDNERGRVTKRAPKPCGKRHHHRAASHIARGGKITTDDYAKPLLLPRRILWCRREGEAEKWLRRTRLPWWFFGSFINFCWRFRSGDYGLTQCLRSYPMDEQVLIESMEEYLHDWIGEEGMDHTVIVDLYELEHHRHPAYFLEKAQRDLLFLVQHAPERNHFYLMQRRKLGMLSEEDKEFLRINPTGWPSFTLPIRSGVSHSVIDLAHAPRVSTIKPSQQLQDDKALRPDAVVVPAPEPKTEPSAANSADSQTFTMALRPNPRRSIRAAPEPAENYHGFLVLRSQTRINRANFFGR